MKIVFGRQFKVKPGDRLYFSWLYIGKYFYFGFLTKKDKLIFKANDPIEISKNNRG